LRASTLNRTHRVGSDDTVAGATALYPAWVNTMGNTAFNVAILLVGVPVFGSAAELKSKVMVIPACARDATAVTSMYHSSPGRVGIHADCTSTCRTAPAVRDTFSDRTPDDTFAAVVSRATAVPASCANVHPAGLVGSVNDTSSKPPLTASLSPNVATDRCAVVTPCTAIFGPNTAPSVSLALSMMPLARSGPTTCCGLSDPAAEPAEAFPASSTATNRK
jgi:hypothetical protein